MQGYRAVLLLPLLAAAPAPPQDAGAHDAQMDRIERLLILPEGAMPRQSYGRNYAPDGPDKIIAIYTVPPERSPADQGCEVMLADLTSRPCSRREIAKTRKAEDAAIAAQAAAGQRRWYDTPSGLPRIADGGCSVVTIAYSVPKDQILSVACNGG